VTDWKARAEREAAALLTEVHVGFGGYLSYQQVEAIAAAAWLQGCNFGMHDALAHVDATFEELRATL
jgi:hypothetical protein